MTGKLLPFCRGLFTRLDARTLGLLGFVITITTAWLRGLNNTSIPDAKGYIQQAIGMLKGWEYITNNPDQFGHGLGFSALIAITFFVTNSESLVLFKIILAVFNGLSAYLLARVGQEVGFKSTYWKLASIALIFDPFVLFAATDIQTECITTTLSIYWAYMYLQTRASRLVQMNILLYGLLGFYTVVMRPNSLLPLALVSLLIIFKWLKEKLYMRSIAISAGIFLSLISFYEVIITRIYSGFVFLTPIGGASSIYMCKKELIPQYLGIISKSENDKINLFVNSGSAGIQQILEQSPGQSVYNVNSQMYSLGKSICLENPLESLEVLAIKGLALWRPFTVFGAYGWQIFLFSLILWLPLTITAIIYLTRKSLNKSEKDLRRYFLVLSVGYTLSLLLTPTQIRHRIAFAEPFYWLFLFHFISINWARFKTKIFKIE
jgi:hypothetical protein